MPNPVLTRPPIPKINIAHPLVRGMLIDMPFYEGAGTVANNLAAPARPGTISGATWVNDVYGKALNFAGQQGSTGDNVAMPVAIVTLIQSQLSLAAWVRRTGNHTVAGNQNIMRHNSAGTDHLWFNFQSDGKLRLYLSEGSNPSTTSTLATAQDTLPHLAVASWNGATVNLYFDGVLVGTQAVTGTLNLAGFALNVGGGANTGPILGTISGARVWNRGITLAEVKQMYLDYYCIYQRPKLLRI